MTIYVEASFMYLLDCSVLRCHHEHEHHDHEHQEHHEEPNK